MKRIPQYPNLVPILMYICNAFQYQETRSKKGKPISTSFVDIKTRRYIYIFFALAICQIQENVRKKVLSLFQIILIIRHPHLDFSDQWETVLF